MNVKWAVIGAGGIARRRTIPEVLRHAQSSEIVALMDVDGQVARETGEAFGIDRTFTTVEDVLNSPCEAVYIASPVYSHYEQGIAALNAGKHVLIEKPMALNEQEATAMAELAASKNLMLGVALMMRYNVYHGAIKEMIDRGELGQLVAGRSQLTCWYPPMEGAWRQVKAQGGGGALSDMGCHCIDLLEWLLGPAVEVTAYTGRLVHDYEVEDTSTVLLRTGQGAQGIVDNYFNVPDPAARNVLEIYGTKGAIFCRGTVGQDGGGKMEVYTQEAGTGYDAGQVRSADDYREVILEPVSLYAQEVDAMSHWIRDGQEPLISVAVGLRNIRVVEAAYRSADEKRTIPVA